MATLWATNSDPSPDHILVIDTGTNSIVNDYEMIIDPVSGFFQNAHGIVHDGSHLWITDFVRGFVYKYTPTGDYVDTMDLANNQLAHTGSDSTSGIAFDGTNFWISMDTDNVIHQFDTDWNLLNTHSGDSTITWMMSHAPSGLWINDYGSADKFYQFDTSLSNVIRSFSTPSDGPFGVAAVSDDDLWIVTIEPSNNILYNVDGLGNVISSQTFSRTDTQINDVTLAFVSEAGNLIPPMRMQKRTSQQAASAPFGRPRVAAPNTYW